MLLGMRDTAHSDLIQRGESRLLDLPNSEDICMAHKSLININLCRINVWEWGILIGQ
jgi:hypothetical protein